MMGQLCIYIGKKKYWESNLTPYTKLKFKWIADLKYENKAMKFLNKNKIISS